MPEPQRVDYLVVGSGIAGLWFAHRAASLGSVLVITKKQDAESATNYAQGGIAAAVADNDSPQLHSADTIAAGVGLAHQEIARLVTQAGPVLAQELNETGVRFTTYVDAGGHDRFDLGQEGGHHRRRILHAEDFTGLEIERGLIEAVRSHESARISEDYFAVDLLADAGRVGGVLVLDTGSGRLVVIRAGTVLLATGGIGQVYPQTTNPVIATGDGIAMGFRSGARVANMEFIQFHPTSLYGHTINGRAFLISEAVRGEGAILRAQDGTAFMERYHPDGSLAPRDVVARAIHTKLKQRGEEYVLLDATHLNPEMFRRRFPNIHRECVGFGFDPTMVPLPVVPAAHYVCGGLAVDEWGRTSLPGLYATGECACTGLHGANRLASNSLLEALVFADRAAQHATTAAGPGPVDTGAPDVYPAATEGEEETATRLRRRLNDIMWQDTGIVRSDAGLARAAESLRQLEDEAGPLTGRASVACLELRNLLTVARLIVTCARRRPESRGLHYNEDHPKTVEGFNHDTIIDAEDTETRAS